MGKDDSGSSQLDVAKDTTPAFAGGDLPQTERVALAHGHDADIPEKAQYEASYTNVSGNGSEQEGLKDAASTASINATAACDVEKAQPAATAAEAATATKDPNAVDWDGPEDPQNPLNWPARKKMAHIVLLSFLTFVTPLASSMFAPSVPSVLRTFRTQSELLATWVVSVYVLGFAAGPLLVAPLSEMYGRLPLYHCCNILFTVFTIACGFAQSMDQLIVFRFFAGAFGISPVTLGGGTIADMTVPEKRGAAMAMYSLGPLLGPVVGPVCGGFISQAKGWRWIFYVLAIAGGAMTIVCFIIFRETYGPTILERRTRRLRKETGNAQLRSKLDLGISNAEFWRRSLVRPMKLIFTSLIASLMNLYTAVVYGILYLLFTTFTFVFEDSYGFSQSIVGLVYIGLGVGLLMGLFVLGATTDRVMKRLADKHNNGVIKPEHRLPFLIVAGPFLPAGLFIYGWAAQYRVHWIVPIIGTALVGIGLLAAFMCINMYLIDAFGLYAASAIASNTILRSVFGAVFPLFALQMYNALGLGWGNSLLAFVALALCVVPIWFYYKGETLRTHPRWQVRL